VRGAGAEFFEVAKVEGPREARAAGGIHEFREAQQEIDRLIQQAEELDQKIKESEESRESNPWVNRVRWASHLESLDRKELRGLVARPDKEKEVELQVLGRAFR